MRDKRTRLILMALPFALAAVTIAGQTALAQCAMCRTAVGSSAEAAKLARSLNFAILILLIPPVAIFCGIFLAAFRRRKGRGEELEEETKARVSWREKLSAHREGKARGRRKAGGAHA
jgi:hypothetical protein